MLQFCELCVILQVVSVLFLVERMIFVKRKLVCLLLAFLLLGSLCAGVAAEENHAAPVITRVLPFVNGVEVDWQYMSDISSYKVQLRPVGGSWKTIATLTSKYDYDYVIAHSKLISNTTYEIRVGATYPDDTKTYYSEVSTLRYLAPPTGVSLVNTINTLKLTWDAVEGATGYYVYRSNEKYQGYELVKTVLPGGRRQYANIGRTNGEDYYYYVVAYGTIDGEEVVSGETKTTGGVRLRRPEITACSSPCSSTVSVSWDKNSKAYYYQVRISSGSKSTVTNTSDTHFTINTLTPGKTYEVQVRSVVTTSSMFPMACLESAWSEPVSIKVSTKTPTVPGVPQNVQARIVMSRDDISGMKISCDPVEGATEYQIFYRKAGSTTWKLWETTQNGATFYSGNNGKLNVNGVYDFKMVARTIVGDTVLKSGDSEVIHAVNFSTYRFSTGAVSNTTGKIKVTWSAVDNADGYQIKYIAPDGTVKYKVYYGNVTSGTLSALQSGAQYAVFVRPFHLFDGVRFYGTWLTYPSYVIVK